MINHRSVREEEEEEEDFLSDVYMQREKELKRRDMRNDDMFARVHH